MIIIFWKQFVGSIIAIILGIFLLRHNKLDENQKTSMQRILGLILLILGIIVLIYNALLAFMPIKIDFPPGAFS